jgi:hypothetical protein
LKIEDLRYSIDLIYLVIQKEQVQELWERFSTAKSNATTGLRRAETATTKNSSFDNRPSAFLSAPIHNFGKVLAAIFFPNRTLGVEWIRSLIFFLTGFTGLMGFFSPAARYL